MTLMEVLMAVAIFLLALVAIDRLVTLSYERATVIRLQGEGMQLCQSKMAEIYAGVMPLSSQSDTAFDGDYGEDWQRKWQWSADCSQGAVTNLWTVTVRVSQTLPSGSRFEVVLTQMMLDPSIRGTSVNLNSTSGSSSGSTSGATTGGM
jgi:type II secretion system protein I